MSVITTFMKVYRELVCAKSECFRQQIRDSLRASRKGIMAPLVCKGWNEVLRTSWWRKAVPFEILEKTIYIPPLIDIYSSTDWSALLFLIYIYKINCRSDPSPDRGSRPIWWHRVRFRHAHNKFSMLPTWKMNLLPYARTSSGRTMEGVIHKMLVNISLIWLEISKNTTPGHILNITRNLQYFHRCSFFEFVVLSSTRMFLLLQRVVQEEFFIRNCVIVKALIITITLWSLSMKFRHKNCW